MNHCQCLTVLGKPCKNSAIKNSKFCSVHQNCKKINTETKSTSVPIPIPIIAKDSIKESKIDKSYKNIYKFVKNEILNNCQDAAEIEKTTKNIFYHVNELYNTTKGKKLIKSAYVNKKGDTSDDNDDLRRNDEKLQMEDEDNADEKYNELEYPSLEMILLQYTPMADYLINNYGGLLEFISNSDGPHELATAFYKDKNLTS